MFGLPVVERAKINMEFIEGRWEQAEYARKGMPF